MAHRIAPEAEADLDDIWWYIARGSGTVEIADNFTELLTGRFYLLANNPYIGRRRDRDLRPGLRSFPVGNYIIFYQIEGDEVLILRVLRGSRDIEAIFGRD